MSRDQQMPAAMMAAFAGLQGGGGVAAAFATSLVMYTLRPWTAPTETELERAMHAAERFKLSADLAVFLPPEPGKLSRRARKDAYKGVVIALKRVDEMAGDERAEAIAQVRTLLGAE
ncbi:MAG: hypothetical protein ACYC77_02775 [Coriobacteriia bacterium]